MDLSTITVPRDEARKAFLEYRGAVRQEPNPEDEAIMRGYKWLASGEGRLLLHLSRTMLAGGMVEKTYRRGGEAHVDRLPALAVARADADFCWIDTSDGRARFRSQERVHPSNRRDVEEIRGWEGFGWSDRWRAMVPIIPPSLRPKRGLGKYHILWEAEWTLTTPAAPTDPALIRRLAGDLFAVVAVWDLTELERAVLTERAR